jgi:tRNA(Arg) A34 adenosine deaminase TadA
MVERSTIDDIDRRHLRRCIELAAEAVGRGDHPFGSLLVDGDGRVLAERSNEVVTTRDPTAHPELALAQWAARHLDDAERAASTMYTSGEHCAMCAAAHVWVGIGRLVYVLSSPMLRELVEPGPWIAVRAADLAAASNRTIDVVGPCDDLVPDVAALFSRRRG